MTFSAVIVVWWTLLVFSSSSFVEVGIRRLGLVNIIRGTRIVYVNFIIIWIFNVHFFQFWIIGIIQILDLNIRVSEWFVHFDFFISRVLVSGMLLCKNLRLSEFGSFRRFFSFCLIFNGHIFFNFQIFQIMKNRGLILGITNFPSFASRVNTNFICKSFWLFIGSQSLLSPWGCHLCWIFVF